MMIHAPLIGDTMADSSGLIQITIERFRGHKIRLLRTEISLTKLIRKIRELYSLLTYWFWVRYCVPGRFVLNHDLLFSRGHLNGRGHLNRFMCPQIGYVSPILEISNLTIRPERRLFATLMKKVAGRMYKRFFGGPKKYIPSSSFGNSFRSLFS